VTTVWFRQHPRNIPGIILDAHLLLSVFTVAILATISVLALRKSPRRRSGRSARS
jgi:hypothetical protein